MIAAVTIIVAIDNFNFAGAWPIQARFWLEWGSSTAEDVRICAVLLLGQAVVFRTRATALR